MRRLKRRIILGTFKKNQQEKKDMTESTRSASKTLIGSVGFLAVLLFVFGVVQVVMTIRLGRDLDMAGFVAIFAGMMGGAIYKALRAISRS
jgi:hypothetical protein